MHIIQDRFTAVN